jgi:hypothetical protein
MDQPRDNSGRKPLYALSLRQPWATLLISGHKTVEIRRWPTTRRGIVLIHAAQQPDRRREAWSLLPLELLQAARRFGGIIGSVELTECVAYRTFASFAADRDKHLNEPAWFAEPVLYGFKFAHPTELPFEPYSGWRRFFPVGEQPPRLQPAVDGLFEAGSWQQR